MCCPRGGQSLAVDSLLRKGNFQSFVGIRIYKQLARYYYTVFLLALVSLP